MAKAKLIKTRTGQELAKALGLKPSIAREWEVQLDLLAELRRIVAKDGLTHAQIARKAGTSRTRITSILNGNLIHVSTDLLIRILSSLGYEVNIYVTRSKAAA